MNSFYSSPSQKFALIDPRAVLEARGRFRREVMAGLMRANSIYVPSGRYRTRGWILLDRGSINQFNQYSTNFKLDISDTVTLQGLSIVHAQCVTRGLTTDPNAIYLIELTDGRGVVSNQWFDAPLTAAYNIRAPAYPQQFFPWSENNTGPWSWRTMIQDMWSKVSGSNNLIGSTQPTIPITPTGTPENFWYPGVPGWKSICDVLDQLGLTVAVDPTVNPALANPYSIVQVGAVDSTFTGLQAIYSNYLEDDLEWLDSGSGRVPGSVTVAFRKRYSTYGTEEVARLDAQYQWESGPAGSTATGPYYLVTVNAPSQFTGAKGTDLIWDDFSVQYDQEGVPLPSDTSTASSIAQERVTQYYNRIYRGTQGYMTQTYYGALPFKAGSLVDGVCWFQDFNKIDDRWQGWRTQIMRGDVPPWEHLYRD